MSLVFEELKIMPCNMKAVLNASELGFGKDFKVEF